MEAIILAGGLGTRLRSAVSDLPKCLAPIRNGSQPFLFFLLEELGRQGVSRVILSVGYMREAVMEWMASGEWPFEVDYAVEESPLGTGGAIRLALSMAREERVLVLNGDTFFQVPSLKALLSVDAPIALALKPMRDFDRYGEVEISPRASLGRDDSPVIPSDPSVIPSEVEGSSSCPANAGHLVVTAFREKCFCREGLINGGVYAVDRGLFEGMDLPEKFSFEKAVLEPFAARGQVRGLVSDGYFIDIGVPEDYARARQELPELQRVLRAYSLALATPDSDALFLDRDGVINRWLPGDYVKRWEEFVFLPGVLQMLSRCAGHFRHIIIVSNQRGVGRGRMSREALDAIHQRMVEEIERAGGRIDAIYVSTAIADDDPSRKPQPGMFLEACRDYPDIRPERSLMMGDSDSDAAFAAACGMSYIRV